MNLVLRVKWCKEVVVVELSEVLDVLLRVHVIMDFLGVNIKDGSEMEPPIEAFVLILSLDQVKEVFFFQVTQFNMGPIRLLLLKILLFFELDFFFLLNGRGTHHFTVAVFILFLYPSFLVLELFGKLPGFELSKAPFLTWSCAHLSTRDRWCLTQATHFLFLHRHVTDGRGATRISALWFLVVVLQECPLILCELSLYFLYDFLQGYFAAIGGISFEIIDEILVTTYLKDVP